MSPDGRDSCKGLRDRAGACSTRRRPSCSRRWLLSNSSRRRAPVRRCSAADSCSVVSGAMALWTRLNRRALDQLGWCECAAATITVRVIPSDRPEPEHAEKDEEEETRVFALVARWELPPSARTYPV